MGGIPPWRTSAAQRNVQEIAAARAIHTEFRKPLWAIAGHPAPAGQQQPTPNHPPPQERTAPPDGSRSRLPIDRLPLRRAPSHPCRFSRAEYEPQPAVGRSPTPLPSSSWGVAGLTVSSPSASPSRSHYHLSREEWIKGIANRFVFSQIYLYLYLSMAILSLTTVILSLLSECPTLSFYILELIVNLAMILEVVTRLVAFGKQFWKSPFNWLDLMITLFCLVTVMVIFVQGCKAKKEEVFDTFLLVIRNAIQFFRLALMLRRSGKNIFTTIQPIDLEGAIHHTDAHSFFLDLDEEEEFLRRSPASARHANTHPLAPSDSAAVPFLPTSSSVDDDDY